MGGAGGVSVDAGKGGAGGRSSSAGSGGTHAGGTGSGGAGGTIGDAGMGGTREACVRDTPPGAALRRLTRFQLENVLRDIFGEGGSRTASLIPYDTATSLSDDGLVYPAWVAAFHELAHDLAVETTETNAAVTRTLGCDPDVEGEASCLKSLQSGLLPRLLRRPPEQEDYDEYDAVYAAGLDQGGTFASGVRMVLEVALQSPDFLYRIELGEPLDVPSSDPRAGWGRPTSSEMASRLSFLLWGSAPDAELLAEAAAGGLRTQAEVRAAAERLMGDERATAAMRYLHLRVLGLLNPVFPPDADEAFTERTFLLMQSETAAFLDDVAASGPGGFASLLTAPYTFVNDELAAFYGIPDVTGSDLRKVALASPPYSGILSQGSFLSAHSVGAWTSPAARGVAVRAAFLCESPPTPPPNAHESLPDAPGSTTRERVELGTMTDPSCAGCHSVINPPGFALESFDAFGRYRSTEAGKPINAQADVSIGGDTFVVNGASELGRALADSSVVKDCYVQNWVALAYGTTSEAPLDECSRAQLLDAFERSNGDLRALVLELTQTDAFLYRRLEPL
jgi:hypothetical protein